MLAFGCCGKDIMRIEKTYKDKIGFRRNKDAVIEMAN